MFLCRGSLTKKAPGVACKREKGCVFFSVFDFHAAYGTIQIARDESGAEGCETSRT